MKLAAHTGVLVLLLACCFPLQGIDFPDHPDTALRGGEGSFAEGELVVLPDISGSLSYENTLLTRDDTRLFNLRCGIYGTAIQLDDFYFKVFFDSILLAGPVHATETPASAVEFWLNAVQYEYGIEGRMRLDDWYLSTGYSRSSLHPLRSGFEETAYDVLKAGAVSPSFRLGRVLAGFSFHGGYHTLFNFWESRLSRYRVEWSAVPRLHLETRNDPTLYAWIEPALLFLRSGNTGYEIFSETGLRIAGPGGAVSIYLWSHHCDDTELLADKEDRCAITGLGIRISTSP